MSKAKAVELKEKLQKLPKHWPQNEKRVLIRQGVLFIEADNKLKPRWCFLFNDCFLECKPDCEFADNFTRLAEPSAPYRFKNYVMLNRCCIEENPNTIKTLSKEEHKTQPFIIIGQDLEEKQRKTQFELIYSACSVKQREMWCSDIHSCICNIHCSVNNERLNYGWHNQYRKGTIFHAVYTLHSKLLKQLIVSSALKINEELKDIHGHNLLHLAMAVNNVDFVEDYGASINIDDVDNNGWSPLRIGCDNNSLDAVRVLTEELYPNLDEYYPSNQSLNPNGATKELIDDRTILHELCRRGEAPLVDILLNTEQINMEALDKHGCTPLHVASKNNEEECVILLLQNGAPPNIADFKGNRALHHTNKETVARWLIAYGARLELVNHTKTSCGDIWRNKLDKYMTLTQVLQETDCCIQSAPTETNAWFDDKYSDACLLCASSFTVFSRRHHCRACGLLVCQQCSQRKLQFNKDSKTLTERACDKCFNKNHSKVLSKKQYCFMDKKYNMIPKEFYKMCVMETAGVEQKTNEEEKEKGKGKGKSNTQHILSKSVGFLHKNKAKTNKNVRYAKHEVAQSEAITTTHKALNKAQERGEKLSVLQDKSDQMSDAAQNFNSLAKQLANKKW